MDDCLGMGKKNWTKSLVLEDIFANGRHKGITYIMALQMPLALPPQFRANIDYVFITGDPGGVKNGTQLFDNYVKGIDKKDVFMKILKKCTTGYKTLVIKNCDRTNEFENTIFHYTAKEHPGFKMFHPKIWEFNGRKYNPNYKQKIKEREVLEKKEKERYKKAIIKKKTKIFDDDIVLVNE